MSELNWDDYPNFKEDEFRCSCGCDRANMDPEFMAMLQAVRDRTGPMFITSGFRCPNHREERKKKKPGSHSIGCAVDIRTDNARQRADYIENWVGFVSNYGVGVGRTFTHLDSKHPYLSRLGGVMWPYG